MYRSSCWQRWSEIFQCSSYPKYKFAKVITEVKGYILLSFPTSERNAIWLWINLYFVVYMSQSLRQTALVPAQSTAEHSSTMHRGVSRTGKPRGSGQMPGACSSHHGSWQDIGRTRSNDGHAPPNIKESPWRAVVAKAGCGCQGRGVCRTGAEGVRLTREQW